MTETITSKDLRQILDSVSDIVVVWDSTPLIVMVNQQLCNAIDIEAREWIGKSPEQIVREGYLDTTIVQETIKTGKEAVGIIHARTGIEVMSRCRPIYDDNGKIKFLVTTSTSLAELEQLKAALQKEHYQAVKIFEELKILRRHLMLDDDFVLESPDMADIMQSVKKIAPLDCNVMITGESGVGKEVIAKTIHMNSARRHAPFIPVNIPSMPESLLEAELFGYRDGAFTGAMKGGKLGLFEVCHGGTIFLDEVGDIPFGIQVKILRAIDKGEIVRIGDTKTRKFDARIVAATNKDLEMEVKRGNFREDLYYRLNVVPIRIKSLRERPEAILPLSLSFLDKINKKYSWQKHFTHAALEALKSYPWPGNIRELRNVVERIAILAGGNTITENDVQPLLFGAVLSKDPPKRKRRVAFSEYDDYEKTRILEALKRAKGNKSKAAGILGMSRYQLYRKFRQYVN